MNLCRHLVRASKETPKLLAVAVQKKQRHIRSLQSLLYDEMTFSELNDKSDHMAHALLAYGLKPGMKAVLMVTPSIEFFVLTFALFKTGIIPVFVDPGMGVKNLKQCFEEARPDIFIGIPKAHFARRLLGWGKKSLQYYITVGGSHFGRRSPWGGIQLEQWVKHTPKSGRFRMAKFDEHDMAAILFTSGSTGTPKGVVYSHGMFEAQISALKDDYDIQVGERDLATFPLFSLFGPALGMASIVPDMDASKPITADPALIFAAIERYQCSNIFINPALIERLGKAGLAQRVGHKTTGLNSLKSIKRVISAGAPATISSVVRFGQLLPVEAKILTSYGATESLPLSQISHHELLKTADATNNGAGICVGEAINGVDIKVIDITEQPIRQWQETLCLSPFEIGEIVVKGPMVSQSYYQRAQADLLSKITDGDIIRHRMGDLGYLDDMGKLWMCGRKAHRVEAQDAKGLEKRYYSIPCERIFNTHPLVKRSALVGVSVKEKTAALICIELSTFLSQKERNVLLKELTLLASQHHVTLGIEQFLFHKRFPVDIRHNAKIFREKLAIWAQQKMAE
ncbi:olefin beta-lactone synthetase [Shewanella surugensis]|uniref:AMP-binding protein n=1 Tax=Shewanella surugensis TaxID=212020 RepID=A0ABT0L7Q0_9GAMM|nr:fatty acid CoA ligase family protein [Shewanella surugensis]MCL1123723.1 AMP-binding protein [Shewanella surugensis]